jgi:hypothetical protein
MMQSEYWLGWRPSIPILSRNCGSKRQNRATNFTAEIFIVMESTPREAGRAEAIRDLILRDAGYIERFLNALNRMVQDESAAVLSCVVSTLRAVAQHDAAMALELFQKIDIADDGLLATRHVYDFIREGLREHYEELRPYVTRMLRSENAVVSESVGCLAAIAVLELSEAADLADQAAAEKESVRIGVARVAASNIASPACRQWCEQRLIVMFNDESSKCVKLLRNASGSWSVSPLEHTNR